MPAPRSHDLSRPQQQTRSPAFQAQCTVPPPQHHPVSTSDARPFHVLLRIHQPPTCPSLHCQKLFLIDDGCPIAGQPLPSMLGSKEPCHPPARPPHHTHSMARNHWPAPPPPIPPPAHPAPASTVSASAAARHHPVRRRRSRLASTTPTPAQLRRRRPDRSAPSPPIAPCRPPPRWPWRRANHGQVVATGSSSATHPQRHAAELSGVPLPRRPAADDELLLRPELELQPGRVRRPGS